MRMKRSWAAGAAGMLALGLLGVGTTAAQAVTDTFKVVFQDNDNVLAGYSSSGSNFTTTYGMMAGTSPSVALLTNGTYEAAFEANTDDLALNLLGGSVQTTTLGMDKGTSPAIAALPGGGWVAAFQDNDNKLYIYTSSGGKINTDLGMDAGTSPSLAVQPDGAYKVVFQDNDNVLAGYNSSGSNFTTTDGLKAGTTPAIAAEPDGTYEVAVEANTDDLSTVHLGDGYSTNNTTLGMDAGTSPAVAVQPAGTFDVVFQDNDNVLAGYYSSGSSFTTTDGMKAGTSPAITPEPDGTYDVAVEANTDDLSTVHLGDGYSTNNTTLGMDAGTSPVVAIPAPTSTPGSGCGAADNCTPQTFADALLGYPGINGVVSASNEYALETWERAEGGGAGCPGQPADTAPWANSAGPAGNPINTTQQEPGSTSWNSVGVQIYQNYDGVTCWEWGIKANADTLLNGFYANILSVLDNPLSSDQSQCVDLAEAVGNSPWGTGNFSDDC
ncbi:MAG TPA: hypothetical protein VGH27_23060 [Streptosporangiaceae bacterium]